MQGTQRMARVVFLGCAVVLAGLMGSEPVAAAGSGPTEKPPLVNASTGKTSVYESIPKIEKAWVQLELFEDKDGNNHFRVGGKGALDKVKITVANRGVTAEYGGAGAVKEGDPSNYDGVTAFQVLVDQKLFEYKEGIGFVPTATGFELLAKTEKSMRQKDDTTGSKKKPDPHTQTGGSGSAGVANGPDADSEASDTGKVRTQQKTDYDPDKGVSCEISMFFPTKSQCLEKVAAARKACKDRCAGDQDCESACDTACDKTKNTECDKLTDSTWKESR